MDSWGAPLPFTGAEREVLGIEAQRKGGLGTRGAGPMWGHSLSSAGTPKEPGGEFTWASWVAQLLTNLPAMQETLVRSLGWKDPSAYMKTKALIASLVAQMVKNLPAMWETWV